LRARVKATLDAAGVQPAGPDTIVISAPPAITHQAREEPVAAVIEAEPSVDDARPENPPAATELPPDHGVSLDTTH
jgi:hypothetical protein